MGPYYSHVAAVMGTQRLLHHIISFDFIPSSSSTEIPYAEYAVMAANKGQYIFIYLDAILNSKQQTPEGNSIDN